VEHEDMEGYGMFLIGPKLHICMQFPLIFICLVNLMKTVLPLGKDPPAITSLSFNHNGKILAAAATDGMIHMFGILTLMLGLYFNRLK
jgi:hypothetical protein